MATKLYVVDRGSRLRVTDTIRDNGTLVDPASVTFKIRNPAGTITSVTPTRSSTGIYYYDFDIDAEGEWAVRCESTGNVGAEEKRFLCRNSLFS